MNINEVIDTIVESDFGGNPLVAKEFIRYISNDGLFYGICEESIDLKYLEESYREE